MAMRRLRLAPEDTSIPFMSGRRWALGGSLAAAVASLLLVAVLGLNFGIDFRGGIMIEARTPGVADVRQVRGAVSDLGLGDRAAHLSDVRQVRGAVSDLGLGDVAVQ